MAGPSRQSASRDARLFVPRRDLIVLGLTLLVAFALRLYRLGDSNIWWDEGYSVYLARKGLLSLALETASDVHPPLHYWVLHVWIRLVGESEFAIRWSSVGFALLTIPLVYWLGRRIFGRVAGLGAAMLLATSRFHIEWSQQIRMYTLVAALTVITIAITLRLWERPSRRAWLSYIVVTTIGLYTLYLSGIVPLVASLITVVMWLAPIGQRRLERGFLIRWIGAQLVVLALFAPWVALFLQGSHPIEPFVSPMPPLVFFQAVATTFPLGLSAYLERYVLVTLAALAVLGTSLGLIHQSRFQRAGLLLFALVLVPPVIVYALSFPNPILYKPTLQVRYLLIFLPAYHLLQGAALTVLWQSAPWFGGRGASRTVSRSVRATTLRLAPAALATTILAGAALWSLAEYYPTRMLRDDYQTIVSYLRAYAQPGDAVILNSDRDWPDYVYYARDTLPRYGVGSLQPISADGAAKLLAPILEKHGSVWLLTSDNAYDSDPNGFVPAWLQTNARLVSEIRVGQRQLALYSRDEDRGVALPTTVHPRTRADLRFSNGPSIVGFDVPVREIEAGQVTRLAVYWKEHESHATALRGALRLVDAAGVIVRDVPVPIPALTVPESSPARPIVRADYGLLIPAAMPAGRYMLGVAVIEGDRARPLDGAEGTIASLGQLWIHGSSALSSSVSPQQPMRAVLGDRIRLLGYDLAATAPEDGADITAGGPLSPGTKLRLRLYWQGVRAMDRPYTAFLQLVGLEVNPATGNPVWAQHDTYPRNGQHPTSDWVPGEVVDDEYELVVPADAPPGMYRVLVGFYDLATGERLPVSLDDQARGDSIVLYEGPVQ